MQADRSILKELHEEIRKRGADAAAVERYIEDPDVRTAVIRNKNGQIYAFAAAGILETKNLYEEFGDNVEIYGINDGYRGLIEGNYKKQSRRQDAGYKSHILQPQSGQEPAYQASYG